MRTIKTLGIATAMAMALIAFAGAGTASASEFQSPGAGAGVATTWNGERTGSNHKFILGPDQYSADIFSCSTASISGQMTGPNAPDITVAPSFGGCTWNQGGLPMSLTTNGCKYRLRPGAGTENETVGTLDIVGCEKPITFNGYGCKIEIGNQNGLGTVTYKNVEIEKVWTVQATASLSGITYTRQGAGSCVAKDGTFSNGTYTGTWTVTGNRAGKVPVKVFGTAAPAPTKFAAEEAPVTITGLGISNKALNFGENGHITCSSTTYSGTSATVTSESLIVAPTYKSCVYGWAGSPTVPIPDEYITVGGCSYSLQAAGGFGVTGATCASKPLTVMIPGCMITVGPQSGAPGMTYVNEGSGKLRKVKSSPNLTTTSLTYTATGGSCPKAGTYSDGLYRGSATFTATNSAKAAQGISVE